MIFMTAGFSFFTIHSGVACIAGNNHLNCLFKCTEVVLSTIASGHSDFQLLSPIHPYEVLKVYMVIMSVVNAAYACSVFTGSPVSRYRSNRTQSFSRRSRMSGSMREMACLEKNGFKALRRWRWRSWEMVEKPEALVPNISTAHHHLSRFCPGPLYSTS